MSTLKANPDSHRHPKAERQCDHHACTWNDHEQMITAATVVTFARTVVSVAFCLYAAAESSLMWLLIGLAVYWVGDMADGAVARLTKKETRAGAVFDVVSDRLCAIAFYVGFVWLEPTMAIPVAIYLLSFAVVDTYVSLAFLAWPLLSPNYLYLVDRPLWLANYSLAGKAINSSLVAILMVVTLNIWLCSAVALVLLALKIWSLVRLNRIGHPIPTGCSSTERQPEPQ